jgi:hypothetical protein
VIEFYCILRVSTLILMMISSIQLKKYLRSSLIERSILSMRIHSGPSKCYSL